jgi:hypothetical protein
MKKFHIKTIMLICFRLQVEDLRKITNTNSILPYFLVMPY